MNTKDYGDVLLIPNSITADQLPTYFEPLGTVDELKKKYRFVTEQAFEGKAYGMAITGNAQGFVYNKKVWAGRRHHRAADDAGRVHRRPAGHQGQDRRDPALHQLQGRLAADPVGGQPGRASATTRTPSTSSPRTTRRGPTGKEHFIIDSLLYDAVKAGVTEADPTTTNWENSKKLLGTGKIATMMLGSWSIVQMQQAATEQGRHRLPAVPGPGRRQVPLGRRPATTRTPSTSTPSTRPPPGPGSTGSPTSRTTPSTRAASRRCWPASSRPRWPTSPTAGVEYLELNPAPTGEEGLTDRIDNAAEIGLCDPKYRQRIVDAARGAKNETKEAIFADLNKKWADREGQDLVGTSAAGRADGRAGRPHAGPRRTSRRCALTVTRRLAQPTRHDAAADRSRRAGSRRRRAAGAAASG